jgi:hypothetical protein
MAIELLSRRCCLFAASFTLVLGLLAGCGGGGGGGGASTTSATSGSTSTILVTFWTLDTAVGANSPAVNAPGFDAVIHSATLVPGKFGNALHLDPALSSYATIAFFTGNANGSPYLVYPRNTISVALWVKADSLTPNTTYHLFGNGASGIQTFQLKLIDGKVNFSLYDQNTGANDLIAASQTAITAGVWTHIAATYDSSIAKIYLNGTEDASNSVIHVVPNTYNNLFIGGVGDGTPVLTFPGSVDEVLLTSSSLTASQVNLLVTGYRPSP